MLIDRQGKKAKKGHRSSVNTMEVALGLVSRMSSRRTAVFVLLGADSTVPPPSIEQLCSRLSLPSCSSLCEYLIWRQECQLVLWPQATANLL